MKPRVASLIVVLVGCTTSPDRLPSEAYITEAILVPYCGRGGCHSTDTAASSLIFDTIDSAHATLKGDSKRGRLVVAGSSQQSRLFTVLRDSQKVMPPDIPLPDGDVDLIGQWIDDGADGL